MLVFLVELMCDCVFSRVKKSLSETKPDDVDLFTKNVQTFVKDVLANFKEYQFFCGDYVLSDICEFILERTFFSRFTPLTV